MSFIYKCPAFSVQLLTADLDVPGSSPEWVPVFDEARSTALGLPETSSLQGSTSVPEQLNIKTVNGACKLIDGCRSKALFGYTFSGTIWLMPQT